MKRINSTLWMCQACLLGTVSFATGSGLAQAMDLVTVRQEGQARELTGRILVEAQDGGVLLEDRAGQMWAVDAEDLVERRKDAEPFRRWNAAEMAEQLSREYPGFRTHTTARYLIVYNTSQDYARWCGALFERLYLAFSTFWKQRGFALEDPPGPLVAIVFDTKQNFARDASAELGGATAAIIGYYSLQTNRIKTYDLTGVETFRSARRTTTADHINRLLAQPQAERTVATLVHEATHQMAFNCGLQTRYADIPLWVSEGIAVFFETPDLQSKRGWSTIGDVNRVRLSDFHRYVPRRPRDSLTTLLASDERFRNVRTAGDAYAEAWALNYYLLRRRQADYVKYLKTLAEKRPLFADEPQERLDEFRAIFGELEAFDAEFLRYLRTVR